MWQDEQSSASKLSELNPVRFSKQIRLTVDSPSYPHHPLASDLRNSLRLALQLAHTSRAFLIYSTPRLSELNRVRFCKQIRHSQLPVQLPSRLHTPTIA